MKKEIEIDGKQFELVPFKGENTHGCIPCDKVKYKSGYLLRELPSKPDVPEKWEPTENGTYYTINSCGELYGDVWHEHRSDQGRLEVGNCFSTEQEAKDSIIYKAFHGDAVAKMSRNNACRSLHEIINESGKCHQTLILDKLTDLGFIKNEVEL